MRIKWLPLMLVLLEGAAGAEQTFTCVAGSRPRVGMRAPEVRAACGEPDTMVVERVPVRAKRADGSTYIRGYAQLERWNYGRRPTRPAAVLTFELATLKTIEIKPNR